MPFGRRRPIPGQQGAAPLVSRGRGRFRYIPRAAPAYPVPGIGKGAGMASTGSGDGDQGPGTGTIAYADFQKVEVRVGTVVRAEPFPEARRPAIKLWVDFGQPVGVRKSSAQITRHYTPESVVGRQVVAVVNFPAKQIGKFMSEALVLGVPDADGEVVLLSPDLPVPDGGRMY